jgi:hypothetical protein
LKTPSAFGRGFLFRFLKDIRYNIIHKEEENMAKASGNYSIFSQLMPTKLPVYLGIFFISKKIP